MPTCHRTSLKKKLVQKKYRNQSWKKICKKVSESAWEKFGTKKVSEPVSFRFVGLVTHCSALYGLEGQWVRQWSRRRRKRTMGWDTNIIDSIFIRPHNYIVGWRWNEGFPFHLNILNWWMSWKGLKFLRRRWYRGQSRFLRFWQTDLILRIRTRLAPEREVQCCQSAAICRRRRLNIATFLLPAPEPGWN